MTVRQRPRPLATRPTVSVVIPCYNYGRYLPAAVSSVLSQSAVDVDVLIVDDASTDDSAQVAEVLAAADDRVELLRHNVNKGHIQTYNDGLAQVSGTYVVLLSADDLLSPGALARAVALMEAHPSVGFVYGHALWFSGVPPVPHERVRNWSVWSGTAWLRLATRRGRCFVSSPEVVMRRTALAPTGGYDPRLPHSADFDMWLRTAVDWDVGRVNGPAQALYRDHADNMHSTQFAGWVRDLFERRATFEIFFEERASERPDLRAMQPAAMKALAKEAVRHALRAHRDGGSPSVISEHLDFAIETWPPIVHSALWLVVRNGPLRGRSYPLAPMRRLAWRVRRHVAWRLARRYGT